MSDKEKRNEITSIIDPKKSGDHAWFLSLLDEEKQKEYEQAHIKAVMQVLHHFRIRPHNKAIEEAKKEIARLEKETENTAENYKQIKELLSEITRREEKRETYRPFFDEPYFARMDLVDNIEGYNSYYIGKKGDVKLEIVDWRAPLARRYYQKSCSSFKINEYEYKTILRRALRTKNGEVVDFKNEYLSLKDYLSKEEIGGKDEENVLDPYLREIIKTRKEETAVKDIIETIQEKQYEIITCLEDTNFVLQGCAGSGKTMVMLHRLSYLMYNNDNIKPRDVLIITPSDSFNAFIDELAEILQLEKVKTTTAQEYFLQVLKSEKIDIESKIDKTQKESEEYLTYVYSDKFLKDVKKRTDKVYDDLYGLFTGEECKDFIEVILENCKAQLTAYESVKNASTRVRRAVLGEIKEKKEGGLYYTKAFRELINCLLDIEDFLGGTLRSENAKTPDYFYRHMSSFYKSAQFYVRSNDYVIRQAEESLRELKVAIEREISDLSRFKQKTGGVDAYTYADRIKRRKEILEEIEKVTEKVRFIGDNGTAFCEFYKFLKGEKEFCEIGAGEGFIDIVRYFYRETVKKYKVSYGMSSPRMYASDAYALCVLCAELKDRLSPAYNYVFIDEAQDISDGEYALLKKINQKARFNVFGDEAQNVTPWRKLTDKEKVFDGFTKYELNQNYRNTNQIVRFVAENLRLDMESIGFDGPPVEKIAVRNINGFFKEKKGLKAIICSEENKEKYSRKSYNDVSVKGKVSGKKINIMSVYESKGLEFSSVVVIEDGLTESERYIAYTRALNHLAVVKS